MRAAGADSKAGRSNQTTTVAQRVQHVLETFNHTFGGDRSVNRALGPSNHSFGGGDAARHVPWFLISTSSKETGNVTASHVERPRGPFTVLSTLSAHHTDPAHGSVNVTQGDKAERRIPGTFNRTFGEEKNNVTAHHVERIRGPFTVLSTLPTYSTGVASSRDKGTNSPS